MINDYKWRRKALQLLISPFATTPILRGSCSIGIEIWPLRDCTYDGDGGKFEKLWNSLYNGYFDGIAGKIMNI